MNFRALIASVAVLTTACGGLTNRLPDGGIAPGGGSGGSTGTGGVGGTGGTGGSAGGGATGGSGGATGGGTGASGGSGGAGGGKPPPFVFTPLSYAAAPGFTSISGVAANDFYVGTSNGLILHNSGGGTFTTSYTGSAPIRSVSATASGAVYAVTATEVLSCPSGCAPLAGESVFAAFTPGGGGTRDFRSVCGASATSAFAAATDTTNPFSGNSFFYTFNGSSWTVLGAGGTSYVQDPAGCTLGFPGFIAMVGRTGLLRYTTSGTGATGSDYFDIPGDPSIGFRAVAVAPDGGAIAVGTDRWVSRRNPGKSGWTATQLPSGTMDGGTTLRAVTSLSPLEFVAGGSPVNGRDLELFNGSFWTPVVADAPLEVHGLFSPDPNTLIVVGQRNGMAVLLRGVR